MAERSGDVALALDLAKARLMTIGELFVDGARLTLVVRIPDENEADIVISNDTIANARQVLLRRAIELGEPS